MRFQYNENILLFFISFANTLTCFIYISNFLKYLITLIIFIPILIFTYRIIDGFYNHIIKFYICITYFYEYF